MRAATAALALLAAAEAWGCDGLRVENAWIRSAPPGAPTMAGYATLRNVGDRALRIDAVTSPAFGAIETHTTVLEGGMTRMRRVDPLDIAPGHTARLQPGGMHLMLFRPTAGFAARGEGPIRFTCGGDTTVADFKVREPNQGNP